MNKADAKKIVYALILSEITTLNWRGWPFKRSDIKKLTKADQKRILAALNDVLDDFHDMAGEYISFSE